MADEKSLKNAQKVYKTLCDALDGWKWHYTKNNDDLKVRFTVEGDDIPMEFNIFVDPERQLVRLLSLMPFRFSEDKRVEGAVATCYANFKFADGSFDYDMEDGSVFFRLTSSFRDSLISVDALQYMINCACYSVDEYNDKFLMISKGALSITDFLNGD
jgi:hypothetical protein